MTTTAGHMAGLWVTTTPVPHAHTKPQATKLKQLDKTRWVAAHKVKIRLMHQQHETVGDHKVHNITR